MTWSYSFNPATSDKDAVRYLSGDTDFDNQQVQDEEIGWLLSEEANVYLAAAQACGSISAKYARRANRSVGDLKIEYTSITNQYSERAATLEARGAMRAGKPYAGGISKDDKEMAEEDDDRVKPSFVLGIHDNPGADYDPDQDPVDEL